MKPATKSIFHVASHFCWLAALISLAVIYGIWATKTNRFPVPELTLAWSRLDAALFNEVRNQMLTIPNQGERVVLSSKLPVAPGLVKLVGITNGPANFVRIIDRGGESVQEWRPDWFEIWPEDEWLPTERRPVSQPGAELHGSAIAPNGDLIVNFEHLSTVRLDPCGNVVWKLPNLGHHSVEIEEDGSIWVGSEHFYEAGSTPYPGHEAPLKSWTLQHLSSDGEILETIPVIDILIANDLLGLVYMSSTERETSVSGDTLHLNDIEIFPQSLESSVFEPGDIMISLRNINTILVLDRTDRRVKFRSTGRFLRQHDPDFAENDSILVYDNRNLDAPPTDPRRVSRILEVRADSGEVKSHFTNVQPQFFSWVLGKHQPLPNGNHLITSPLEGRAIEVSAKGEPIWHYNNRVSESHAGLLVEASVLPLEMDHAFFSEARNRCDSASSVP